MKNLAHGASFETLDKIAPSKPGTKQLVHRFGDSDHVGGIQFCGQLVASLAGSGCREQGHGGMAASI